MNFLYYFSYNDENLALNDFNDFHMITLIKILSKKIKIIHLFYVIHLLIQ